MSKEVVMLTGASCTACTKLKNILKREGLGDKFKELSVETEEGLNLAKALGARSIPVLIKMDNGAVEKSLVGSSLELVKYKELFS
jgi:glutaredoxin